MISESSSRTDTLKRGCGCAFSADGSMAMYSRYDYDENGNLLQQNNYNPDDTLIRVIKPSDE